MRMGSVKKLNNDIKGWSVDDEEQLINIVRPQTTNIGQGRRNLVPNNISLDVSELPMRRPLVHK